MLTAVLKCAAVCDLNAPTKPGLVAMIPLYHSAIIFAVDTYGASAQLNALELVGFTSFLKFENTVFIMTICNTYFFTNMKTVSDSSKHQTW